MFLKSGKHSSSSNISHFINIRRFLHSKYVAISWASVSSSNGSLNFFNLTPVQPLQACRNHHPKTVNGSKAPASFEDRKIGGWFQPAPNLPSSFGQNGGSFNAVLFLGLWVILKKQNWDDGFKSSSDASHLPHFFWSDLKPKKHVFHKLFFTPAYFWIVGQKSGTFIFFNPAWLLKQLHSLCDLLSLIRKQIWLPR